VGSSEALALALSKHASGNLDQAEQLCRQIVHAEPGHAEALHLLGTILQGRRQFAEAACFFQQAVQSKPDFAEAYNDLGVTLALSGNLADSVAWFEEALRRAPQLTQAQANLAEACYHLGTSCRNQGRLEEAVAHYQAALRVRPAHAELHNDLGVALALSSRGEEAAVHFQEAQRLKPDYPDPPNNLGIVLAKQGKSAEAIACFESALRLKPDYAEAHYNLGTALRNQGRYQDAVRYFRQAVSLKPSYAEAHANLGLALWHQGQLDEAIGHYVHALGLRPHDPETLNNLGLARRDQGQLAEAVAAYQQALHYRPDSVETLTNLGTALKDLGRLDDAVACFRQVLSLRPDYADGHNSLGNTLLEQSQHDAAEASYRRALQLRPDYAEAHNNLGNACADQGKVQEALACYREALRLKRTYASAHSNLLLHMNYLPGLDPAEVFAEHRRWESLHGQPRGECRPHANNRDPDRRLRVGYVTPDLNRHPVARFFVEPILAHHDPAIVETICYAEVPDAMAERVRSLAGEWRSVRGLTDAQVADQVRSDAIDILVDLAGHTVNSRLKVFTYKAAPVQVTALGYPNTTGLSTMDYRLTDAIADPPGEPVRYTEELVRLPGVFCCYAPQEGVPAVAPSPAERNGFVTFGSPHHLAKLHAGVLDLWCAILRALPTARLLLFRHTLRGAIREKLERQFANRGIAGARIELRHATDMSQGFLGFYGAVDITLDAFPWSGHTSACDSLWMGVPLLTLRGTHHAGRMAASVLSAIGLTEWIADRPEDYLAKAQAWAGDRPALARLRGRLRERVRHSPLCDGRTYTRGLESAYRAMWRRWCSAGQG
jgi:predicted O-linked N-acetylglucosamine transferase (SPINDLY family)